MNAPCGPKTAMSAGSEQAADEETDAPHALTRGEDGDPILVAHAALHEREPGDVQDGVAHPGCEERGERDSRKGHGADQDERKTPSRERDHEHSSEAGSAREAERTGSAREPAKANRSGEQADPRVAHVEELVRPDDDEREKQSADRDLRREVADDEQRRRVPPQDAWGLRQPRPRRLGFRPAACVRHALEANPGHCRRRAGEDRRHEHARCHGTRRRDEDSGEQGTGERSQSLAHARCDVGRDELPGRAREGRKQRGLDRPDEGSGAGDDGGEHVRQLDGKACRDDGSGGDGAEGADGVDGRENAIAPEADDEPRRERGGGDPRNDSDRAENPCRERASRIVGHDEEDDEERPVGGRSGRPGDLDPPNGCISEHLAYRDERRGGDVGRHLLHDPRSSLDRAAER